MDQSFSFSSKLGEEYIQLLISDEKDQTNRADTPRRRKCTVDSRMYRYIDQRSPNIQKLPTRRCIARYFWNVDDIPETEKEAKVTSSPRPDLNWLEFAKKDGIMDYAKFVEYFKNHPKEVKTFICFVWSKPIQMRKLTEY